MPKTEHKKGRYNYVFSNNYKEEEGALPTATRGDDEFRKYIGGYWSVDSLKKYTENLSDGFIYESFETFAFAFGTAEQPEKTQINAFNKENILDKNITKQFPSNLNVFISSDFDYNTLSKEDLIGTLFPFISFEPPKEVDPSDPDYQPDVTKMVQKVTFQATHPDWAGTGIEKSDFYKEIFGEQDLYSMLTEFYQAPTLDGHEITQYDANGFPTRVKASNVSYLADFLSRGPAHPYEDYNFRIEAPVPEAFYEQFVQSGQAADLVYPIKEISEYNSFHDEYEYLLATNPGIPESALPNAILLKLAGNKSSTKQEDYDEYDPALDELKTLEPFEDSKTKFDQFITLGGVINAPSDPNAKDSIDEYYKNYAEEYSDVLVDLPGFLLDAQINKVDNFYGEFVTAAGLDANLFPFYIFHSFKKSKPMDFKSGLGYMDYTDGTNKPPTPINITDIGLMGAILYTIQEDSYAADADEYDPWRYAIVGVMQSVVDGVVVASDSSAEFVSQHSGLSTGIIQGGLLPPVAPSIAHNVVYFGPISNAQFDFVKQGKFATPVFSDLLDEFVEIALDPDALQGQEGIFEPQQPSDNGY